MRTRIIAVCTMVLLALTLAASPVDKRTREIADLFRKTKHKQKQKRGVTTNHYMDVRGEALVQDARRYSGRYAVPGIDYSLQIRVAADGQVNGSGIDDGRRFVLEHGRIEGALLTATKAYAGGGEAQIEGAFMNLTVRDGTSPESARTTVTFGLGVRGPAYMYDGRMELDKLFFERQ